MTGGLDALVTDRPRVAPIGPDLDLGEGSQDPDLEVTGEERDLGLGAIEDINARDLGDLEGIVLRDIETLEDLDLELTGDQGDLGPFRIIEETDLVLEIALTETIEGILVISDLWLVQDI